MIRVWSIAAQTGGGGESVRHTHEFHARNETEVTALAPLFDRSLALPELNRATHLEAL